MQSTQWCCSLDERNNDIDTSTPCSCFKLLPFSLNGTVPDAPNNHCYDPCPYCPHFSDFPGKILILFNLPFLLNCPYPTIFWNCHILHKFCCDFQTFCKYFELEKYLLYNLVHKRYMLFTNVAVCIWQNLYVWLSSQGTSFPFNIRLAKVVNEFLFIPKVGRKYPY